MKNLKQAGPVKNPITEWPPELWHQHMEDHFLTHMKQIAPPLQKQTVIVALWENMSHWTVKQVVQIVTAVL